MSVRPNKALGQNFLMHAQTAERIVAAASLAPGMHVLEIGPGTGMLTRALLAAGLIVNAIETDSSLIPILEADFAEAIQQGHLTLLHGDIRTFDFTSLAAPYAVVANIPYYLTGDIMRRLLEAPVLPSSMTLLVQKEVAERIARNNGKESMLSVSVQVYGAPKYMFTVPRGAFRPAPSVDSAVLHVANIHSPFATLEEQSHFFTIVKTAFLHKRKRVAKNLESIAPASAISEAFTQLSLSANTRSEDIPASTWLALASALR